MRKQSARLFLSGMLCCCLFSLAGCPGGKSATVDWATQPHKGTITRPIAAWAIAPVTHSNFATVQTYSGVTVPSWIAKPAAACVDAAIDAELAWSNKQGVPRARGNPGNIEWYLYYDPAMIKSTSTVKPYTQGTFVKQVIPEDGKSVSSIPPSNANILGVAQIRTHGDTLTRCTVWINVTYYEVQRRVLLKQGKTEAQAQAGAALYMADKLALPRTTWHEGGHALFGLHDEPRATVGLMGYRSQATTFSPAETDVIRWLYNAR